MEDKDRIQKLKNKLASHEESLDTAALWADVRTQIPVKQRKPLLPFFLLFLLGSLAGSIITFFINNDNTNTLNSHNKSLILENKKLTQTLADCQTQNTIAQNQENNIDNQTEIKSSIQSTIQPEMKTIPFFNTKNKKEKSNKQNQTQPYNTPSIVETTSAVAETSNSTQQQDKLSPISFINQILTQHEIEVYPILSVAEKQKKSLRWLLGISGGPAFITEAYDHENRNISQPFDPMFHIQAQGGIQKQFTSKLSVNLGVGYQFSAAKKEYTLTTKEKFFLIDTTQINIAESGLISAETGNVFATKTITKKGLAYQTRHLMNIFSQLEYSLWQNMGKSLSISIGMGIPVYYVNTGSVIQGSKKQTLQKDHFIKPGWQYTTGIYFEKPFPDYVVGLHVGMLYDQQKIIFEDIIYTRNYWLPQAGMRIIL